MGGRPEARQVRAAAAVMTSRSGSGGLERVILPDTVPGVYERPDLDRLDLGPRGKQRSNSLSVRFGRRSATPRSHEAVRPAAVSETFCFNRLQDKSIPEGKEFRLTQPCAKFKRHLEPQLLKPPTRSFFLRRRLRSFVREIMHPLDRTRADREDEKRCIGRLLEAPQPAGARCEAMPRSAPFPRCRHRARWPSEGNLQRSCVLGSRCPWGQSRNPEHGRTLRSENRALHADRPP